MSATRSSTNIETRPVVSELDELKSIARKRSVESIFFVAREPSNQLEAISAAAALKNANKGLAKKLTILGMRSDEAHDTQLEEAGADIVVRHKRELRSLTEAKRRPISLSIVLLAYDEQALIGSAIQDARTFCQLFTGTSNSCGDYEVVVVDDGSTDATPEIVEQNNQGDVVLVKHDTNLGMGASMRDGYLAASKDYIAHLPGDRQVRPQSLITMLPHANSTTIPLSTYLAPPSGRRRQLMSLMFRLMVRQIGNMKVNFAGTYLFHRDWLNRIDTDMTTSNSFLYSFELLEQFRRAGAHFHATNIEPFPREVGDSREANSRRIIKMAREVALSNPELKKLRGHLASR